MQYRRLHKDCGKASARLWTGWQCIRLSVRLSVSLSDNIRVETAVSYSLMHYPALHRIDPQYCSSIAFDLTRQ
jgi:hypothetical protein